MDSGTPRTGIDIKLKVYMHGAQTHVDSAYGGATSAGTSEGGVPPNAAT